MERPWTRFYPPGVPARADYPAIPLWGFLERAAVRRPDHVALVAGSERLTYRALWERVLGVAGALDLEPGARVMLRMPNSVGFVASYYGALRAGGIVVAASPEAGPDEIAAPRADCEPVLELDAEPAPGAAPGPPPAFDVAVLQYTSGTTGRPKGAIMSHANLVANALQNARWFQWTDAEVNLAVLPLYHTWGMCVCLNSTMAVGGTLVLCDRFDPEATMADVASHGATVLYGSATMFHRLLDVAPRDVPTLRHVKAGAMLSQGRLKERWDQRYPHAPLQQGFGLTEASPECHNNPPQRFKAGTVGIPIQDTDCRIADPDDRVLPAGEAGEVCLMGPQVTRGYWNGARIDGWLRTGDIGVMDDEGYLTIVDRKKDMLKFRGYTVSPNAIEECLLRHPAVREAVVVGRADEREGEVPVAFVVLAGEASDEALAAHCRSHLARYEVPPTFERVAEIPKNRLGKPLRRVLRDNV